MARSYRRDSLGRFAGGGGGSGRPVAQKLNRGPNRLTRDNAGRIISQGGNGATARGGRIKTASGKQRATQTTRLKGGPAGTIGKPRGLKPGAVRPKAPLETAAAAAKPKWGKVAGSGGSRSTAKIGENRVANTHQSGPKAFSATVVNAKSGKPVMARSGFNNVSQARAWAERPSARGPRLMGGRLKTEASTRSTWIQQKASARPNGTIAKPKGLKPQSARQLRTGMALNRMRGINAKMANKPDIAQQHIPGRFKGQAGKRLDASIDRAVREVQAANRANLMKPKEQVRAERAAAQAAKDAAAAAKPKRSRSPESLRTSRAKQVQKRRGMNISNPAAWRPESAARMAANAERTQQRALALYGSRRR